MCRLQYHGFLAAGPGDRRGAGEGFEAAGVGETAAVLTDLGEHPGTGQVPESGEAGDDGGVRVLLKMGGRGLGEVVGRAACGVELVQQRGELDAHRQIRRIHPQSVLRVFGVITCSKSSTTAGSTGSWPTARILP